jgi:hypothetical protein
MNPGPDGDKLGKEHGGSKYAESHGQIPHVLQLTAFSLTSTDDEKCPGRGSDKKPGDEEISPEKGTVPGGIKRHDQIEPEQGKGYAINGNDHSS